VTIDLREQTILLHQAQRGTAGPSDESFSFAIPESHRHRLLHGLDAIAETLTHHAAIERHEVQQPAWISPQS
jgi:3-isopropylmalate/(R)-2-methylmalate dehydratase small subunit